VAYREERLNSPIQTTGADILKMILIRLSEEEPPYARLLLPVHDEVIFEVEKGYEKEASCWVSRVMTEAVTEVLGEELARAAPSAESSTTLADKHWWAASR
jgi:DNA polymerase I-like protein with 3'-5' exonuclease and polymerase domains